MHLVWSHVSLFRVNHFFKRVNVHGSGGCAREGSFREGFPESEGGWVNVGFQFGDRWEFQFLVRVGRAMQNVRDALAGNPSFNFTPFCGETHAGSRVTCESGKNCYLTNERCGLCFIVTCELVCVL